MLYTIAVILLVLWLHRISRFLYYRRIHSCPFGDRNCGRPAKSYSRQKCARNKELMNEQSKEKHT